MEGQRDVTAGASDPDRPGGHRRRSQGSDRNVSSRLEGAARGLSHPTADIWAKPCVLPTMSKARRSSRNRRPPPFCPMMCRSSWLRTATTGCGSSACCKARDMKATTARSRLRSRMKEAARAVSFGSNLRCSFQRTSHDVRHLILKGGAGAFCASAVSCPNRKHVRRRITL